MARVGKFKVHALFEMTHSRILQGTLLNMHVLKRDVSCNSDVITYTAEYHEFDDIPGMCATPEYSIVSDGYEIKFARII
jgi:hypothetical protein